jgi:hypothetical protein
MPWLIVLGLVVLVIYLGKNAPAPPDLSQTANPNPDMSSSSAPQSLPPASNVPAIGAVANPSPASTGGSPYSSRQKQQGLIFTSPRLGNGGFRMAGTVNPTAVGAAIQGSTPTTIAQHQLVTQTPLSRVANAGPMRRGSVKVGV